MSDIREQVKEAYNQMPDNSKNRAAQIHGVSISYFVRLINGEAKDDDVYYSALNAMKQAASEVLRDVKKKVDAINRIKADKIA